MGRIWEKYIGQQEKGVYPAAGFGTQYGIGSKPALVVVDVTYGFTGDGPEDIHESVQKYPTSCGQTSWVAIPHIQSLVSEARDTKIPVIYTIIEGNVEMDNDRVAVKGNIFNHPALQSGEKGARVVDELTPLPGELVISKKKPSAFFGTPLLSYLVAHQIDTLIVTGCTTSGCVRATVVDAFSYNYQVVVPEECVFDRSPVSHAINLFDMHQKYADVWSVQDLFHTLKSRAATHVGRGTEE